MADSSTMALPLDALPSGELLHTLLDISLTGVALFRPVYEAAGNTLTDFTYEYLNPAAQQLLGLPQRPTASYLAIYPMAGPAGSFAFYRDAFLSGETRRQQLNFQHNSLDGYFQQVAQRQGPLLLVSFLDTQQFQTDQQAQALRQSQTQEQLARVEAERAQQAALASLQAAEQQQRRLSQILGQVPAAVVTLSGPEHRFSFANEHYQVLVGGRATLGQTVAEALPEVVEQGFITLLDQVYTSGQPYIGLETPILLFNSGTGRQEQHYLNFTYQPLTGGEEDHTQGILAFAVDVTEAVLARRQAETMQAAMLAAARRQVQQRQDLYHIFEQAPTAIVLLREPDHRIDYHNPIFTDIFPPEAWSGSLRGFPIDEVYPQLRVAGLLALLDRVYASGKSEVLTELPLSVLQPGSPRYITLAYQAYREQDRIVGVAAFAYDVTEQVVARHQLNQQQEANEQQLRRIFTQAPVALGLFQGSEARLELANAAMSKLLGRPLEQFAGKPIFEAAPELRDQGFEALLEDVRVNGTPHDLQEVPVLIDRSHTGLPTTGYFNISYQPYRDGTGTIIGALALGMEVTDQVLARRQAEHTAQRLRLLTDALPVLIGYLDRNYVYRFTNEAYRPWFNQDPAALLGRPVREVVGEAAYQRALPSMERALAGERVDFEAQMPYREGFARHIRSSYIPDVQDGQVLGFYTLVTDITQETEARERVQALNDALQATNAQLTRTNADLDTFVYTASHDLKSPITNIEGLLTALRESLPASTAAPLVERLLGMMEGAVARFQETLHHLTDVTRLQQAQELPAEALDLPALVEDVRLDMLPELTAAQATLGIDLEHCPSVRFAAKSLRSILYNLLSNAVKYRDADRPLLVQLRCGRTATSWMLEVQDNGLGLTQQQQDGLFHLFRRMHTHVQGSGVGLYMVKRLIENAGGTITVQSLQGVGSTFTVTLPVAV